MVRRIRQASPSMNRGLNDRDLMTAGTLSNNVEATLEEAHNKKYGHPMVATTDFSGLQSSVCAFANAGRAAKLLLDHRAQLRQVVLQDLPRAATTDPGSCSWRYSLLIVRKPEIAWLVPRSCRQTKSRYEIISGPLIDSTVRRGSKAAPWSKMMPRPTPARTPAITPS
jgi:hypothetical protein